MKELADLNYKELDSLSVEEKLKFLEEEFNMYEMNSQLQYDISQLNENNIIKFLESVVNGKSNFEVTQAGEYPAKKVAGIYKHANIEESEFFELLRILYLNDYVEVFKYKEFHIEEESVNSIFDNTPDNTHQHRYNLHRLYKTSKELFNEENYNGMENKGSEATMYYKFLKYGTIVDKICSYNTLIRLSNKGMHYLHFVTSKRNLELMHKQEETLEVITDTKKEQSRLLDTFEEYKVQQNSNIESINTLIDNHSNKIKDFYKDITTILSLMLAAFALIGVNISAIPKIENNFTANLLAMNLSLILCLLVLFYILRVIVYDANINSKHFYPILILTIIGIVGVFIFLGFNHESKIEVIEKKYQQMIKDYKQKNEEHISKMENQIESLEKQLKENQR